MKGEVRQLQNDGRDNATGDKQTNKKHGRWKKKRDGSDVKGHVRQLEDNGRRIKPRMDETGVHKGL